jgi:alkylation response protein AidB-like acyl-CoA dehydrogenase
LSTLGAGNARLRPVDVDLPPEDDPRRVEIRHWFDEHPTPSARELVDAGFVVPHWPRPYGLDADPALQLIIEGEMRRAGVSKPMNPIGFGHCGPIIVALGNDEQKQRYLLPMLAGEELWCQLFSEPGAGSDLANLGTRAERDGDVYRVNGQKIWTSLADHAEFGILIARTSNDVSKHRGISYFIIAMDLPGIEVRPIRNMTGESGFNEVFFDDVRVPAENLIGEENLGWGMAKSTLANERVSLSTGGGLQWGYGPSARDLVTHFRDNGGLDDRVVRQEVVRAYIEGEILRYHRMRMISAAVNKKPGPDASLRKALADPHGKKVFTLAKNLMGAGGMLTINGALDSAWDRGFLFSPALTVGGGTSEVLRNIIAERLLGLPHDLDVEQGKTWSETRRGTSAPA